VYECTNVLRRNTDKKVSSALVLLCGTDAEAATLCQVQMKAAEASASSALASVRTKERKISVSDYKYASKRD